MSAERSFGSFEGGSGTLAMCGVLILLSIVYGLFPCVENQHAPSEVLAE